MIQTCRVCLRSSPDIINDVSDYAYIILKVAQIEVNNVFTKEFFKHTEFNFILHFLVDYKR